MTLEEKFAEMFPEYVAGSELLSPYWDLFEAGAELIEVEKDRYIQELRDEAGQRLEEKDKQIEKMKQELEEYKNEDVREICKHKYFVNSTTYDGTAVVCHTLIDCKKCARYKEN